MLYLHLEATRNRSPGHPGRRAGTSKETDKIKNNLAAPALECPLAACQAGLRSQGHGFGQTGMDMILPSQRQRPPRDGVWGVVCLPLSERSAGSGFETSQHTLASEPAGLTTWNH